MDGRWASEEEAGGVSSRDVRVKGRLTPGRNNSTWIMTEREGKKGKSGIGESGREMAGKYGEK